MCYLDDTRSQNISSEMYILQIKQVKNTLETDEWIEC